MKTRKKPSKKDFNNFLQILDAEYSNKITDEPKSVLSQLIFSIIARNFTRKCADKAFLIFQKKFVDWNEVRISSVSEISEVLEQVNAPNVERKAKNIKKILVDIYSDYHKISLEFVKSFSTEKTKKILQGLRGITPRVMDSVLLFALDYPVVPVVSPFARVIRRLGFVKLSATQKEIYKALEKLIPKTKIEKHSRLLIHHGENVCMLQKPNCIKCILKKFCPYPELPKTMKTAAFIKNTETLDIDRLKDIDKKRKKDLRIKEKKRKEKGSESTKSKPKKSKSKSSKKSSTKTISKKVKKDDSKKKKKTTKKTVKKVAEKKSAIQKKKTTAKKTKKLATKKAKRKKETSKKAVIKKLTDKKPIKKKASKTQKKSKSVKKPAKTKKKTELKKKNTTKKSTNKKLVKKKVVKTQKKSASVKKPTKVKKKIVSKKNKSKKPAKKKR